jgi:nuclear GTP-binding protein
VLKGVVRVEALATPSEHIQELMARVKPRYLSRTYGIPLPDKDDPSVGWDPETFLDKLARMKGRLLKGGEPDLDTVAKIMLSDWVRGRIPYFVAPPARSEELNDAEAKKAKTLAADAKGKGKAVEEPPQLTVTQNLGSIMQKNSFLAEDVRPLDVGFGEEDRVENQREGEDEGAESADQEESEEEPLSWNDVYGEEKNASPPRSDEGQQDHSDDDDEGELFGGQQGSGANGISRFCGV